eukprot:596029-Rhodomonas_salina.5
MSIDGVIRCQQPRSPSRAPATLQGRVTGMSLVSVLSASHIDTAMSDSHVVSGDTRGPVTSFWHSTRQPMGSYNGCAGTVPFSPSNAFANNVRLDVGLLRPGSGNAMRKKRLRG